MKVPFCACGDTSCPYNPANHEMGCTPCIEKNLREGEIPSCFFKAVSGRTDQGSYHYIDFANKVLKGFEKK